MTARSNFDKACYELGLDPDVVTYNNPKAKRLCDGRNLDYCIVVLGIYYQQFTVFASYGYTEYAGFSSEYATYRSLVHEKILEVIGDIAKNLIWIGAISHSSTTTNSQTGETIVMLPQTVTLQQCQDGHKFQYLILDIKSFDSAVKFDSATFSLEVVRRLKATPFNSPFVNTCVSDFELITLAEIQVDEFVRFEKAFHGVFLQDAILYLTKAKSISMFDGVREYIHC